MRSPCVSMRVRVGDSLLSPLSWRVGAPHSDYWTP